MFADLRTANGVDLRAHAQITGIVTENGHATESEERVLIRGDLSSREFVAFWIDDHNRIQAAMNVNVWDVIRPLT